MILSPHSLLPPIIWWPSTISAVVSCAMHSCGDTVQCREAAAGLEAKAAEAQSRVEQLEGNLRGV